MGISDLFNSSKLKEENERLKQMVTPEMQNAIDIQQHINTLHQQENSISECTIQRQF